MQRLPPMVPVWSPHCPSNMTYLRWWDERDDGLCCHCDVLRCSFARPLEWRRRLDVASDSRTRLLASECRLGEGPRSESVGRRRRAAEGYLRLGRRGGHGTTASGQHVPGDLGLVRESGEGWQLSVAAIISRCPSLRTVVKSASYEDVPSNGCCSMAAWTPRGTARVTATARFDLAAKSAA